MTDLDRRAEQATGEKKLSRSTVLSRTTRATVGRLSWGMSDQAVSSMTNFVVGAVVARSLGTTGFGIFSLAWVTYGVVLNMSRGIGTDPLAVRFSGVSPESWRAAVARASGAALATGLAVGVVSVLAGAGIGGRVGGAFLALGLVLPALLVQDSWRYAFFAAGQGRRAFVNDAVWAVMLVPALIVAARAGSVFGFVLAWGLAGAVAALFGLAQLRVLPRLSGVRPWLRHHRDLGLRYLAENLTNSGGAQLRMYGLGAIAGLADVGAVRGAQLLLGPFLMLVMGLNMVAVPEAARILRRSSHRLPRFCSLLGWTQACAALAWGSALLFVVPDGVGEFVLGPVWPFAAGLIVPSTLAVAGAGLWVGATAGLRALGASRRSLRAQLLTSAGYVAGGLIGAAVAGALGSAWGVAIGSLLGAAMWWREFGAGLRDTERTEKDDPKLGQRPTTGSSKHSQPEIL